MATEKRLLTDLDAQSSTTWTNESNAFTENDSYASSSANNLNQYSGGDFATITQTPTSFTSFNIRFFDIASDHIDDTFLLEIYDNDSSSWITCETFNSGNLLPTSLTTKDYTSTVSSEYAAASDKTAFLNNLAVRMRCSAKSAGNDGVLMGLAWAYFEYDYSASTNIAVDVTTCTFTTPSPTLAASAMNITATPAIAAASGRSPSLALEAEITLTSATLDAYAPPPGPLGLHRWMTMDPVVSNVTVPSVDLTETGGGTNIAVDPATASVTIPSPTLAASAMNITAGANILTFLAPSPALAASPMNITAGANALAFTVPSPALSAAANITTAANVLTFTAPSPGLSAAATVALNPATATATVPNVDLSEVSGDEIQPDPATASVVVPSPALAASAMNITGTPATVSMVVPTPTLTAQANITAVAVTSTFWVPPPDNGAVAAVSLTSSTASVVVGDPTLALSAVEIDAAAIVLSVVVPNVNLQDQPPEAIAPDSVVMSVVISEPALVSLWDVGKLGDKIYAMLQSYGKPVTIYNRTRSYSTTAKVTMPWPCSDEMIRDGQAKRGDCLVYVPAKNLQILLAAGGWVKMDGRYWIINGVNTIWTFVKPGLYGLHLGKYGSSRLTPSTAQTKLDKKFEAKLPKLFSKVGVTVSFPGEGETLTCIPESTEGEYIAAGEMKSHAALNIYLNGFTLPFTPVEGDEVRLDGIKYIVEAELPVYTGEQIGLFGLRVVK